MDVVEIASALDLCFESGTQRGDLVDFSITEATGEFGFAWYVRVFHDGRLEVAAQRAIGRDVFYLSFEPESGVPLSERLASARELIERLGRNQSRVRTVPGLIFNHMYAEVHEAGRWARVSSMSVFKLSSLARNIPFGTFYSTPRSG